MNNIFSKSPETFEILVHKLDMILEENRHQRIDLASILRSQSKIINLLKLQKQVDDFFDDKEDIPDVET